MTETEICLAVVQKWSYGNVLGIFAKIQTPTDTSS